MSVRYPRDEMTKQIQRLLARICSSDDELIATMRRLFVFGSYRRGAASVGDVDMVAVVDLSATVWRSVREELARKMQGRADYWRYPKDPIWRLRRSLGIVSRSRINLECVEHEQQLDRVEEQPFRDRLLLWERGDSLEVALERLASIEVDADARRHPANVPAEFAWMDGVVSRPVAEELVRAVGEGKLRLSQMALRAAVPSDAKSRTSIESRWSTKRKASERAAALAAAAELEGRRRRVGFRPTFASSLEGVAREFEVRPGQPIGPLLADHRRAELHDRSHQVKVKIGSRWDVAEAIDWVADGTRELFLGVPVTKDGPPWVALLFEPPARQPRW